MDFSNPAPLEGLITFPEWAFASAPAPDSQIKETVIIRGSSGNTNASITGTADQKES